MHQSMHVQLHVHAACVAALPAALTKTNQHRTTVVDGCQHTAHPSAKAHALTCATVIVRAAVALQW